ncbi:MAG: T9SS type A sorting domain-containing protein [Aureispira sp.]|nr:T9SS type A sorting domain-containing protein [Aureispira sp.]
MKNLFVLIFVLALGELMAQTVDKTVIVEHFTNTKCGYCAARNPNLYQNLAQFPNALHIAYHPSSPYSSCVLSQHNAGQNDNRTQYYSLYGGTPRATIQGAVVPVSSQIVDTATIANQLGQQSPIDIRIVEQWVTSDSVRVDIILKTVAAHSHTNTTLYIPITEDLVQYNAPNGESQHHDVFRKAIFDVNGAGLQVTLPTTVGDSLVVTGGYKVDVTWDTTQLSVTAILQAVANKEIIQVARSSDRKSAMATAVQTVEDKSQTINIFPNPSRDLITIKGLTEPTALAEVFNLSGQIILTREIEEGEQISLNELENGVYVLRLQGLGKKSWYATKQILKID